MPDCEERYEVLISSWLDDELERAEAIEMLDHLVACAACRRFFAGARRLDGVLALVRPAPAAGEPPPGLWARIREQAAPPARGAGSRRRARRLAALALAAAVVLAASLGWLAFQGQPLDSGMRLASRPERMSEGRFVDLTRELLAADARYQRAMLQVMSRVVEETETLEAASEGVLRRDDRVRGDEPERRRGPA